MNRFRLWGLRRFLFNVYRISFPWVNRLEREIKPSPPSSAEIKSGWSRTFLPRTEPTVFEYEYIVSLAGTVLTGGPAGQLPGGANL
jgi:hypothetical protein